MKIKLDENLGRAPHRGLEMTGAPPSCKYRSHELVSRQGRKPSASPKAYAKVCTMNRPSRSDLSVESVVAAFEVMGRYLRERGLLGEIAVYGRTAILLQFRWGDSTEDVDVVIRTAERESAVKDAAAFAALQLGLPDDWLNNYVGAFTAESESESFFSAYGAYPRGETPGLRVFLAKPEYICAMKLKALRRETVDDKDFEDAARLAAEIGIDSTDDLLRLFDSYFPGESLDRDAAARLPEVADAARSRRPS